MPSSQHIPDHLKAVRRIAVETSPDDVVGTVALAIQRVKVTMQNLSLLANKTPEVEAAAREVEACLPAFVGGQWSGAFFGERLLAALDAFEPHWTPPDPARWPSGSGPGKSAPPRFPLRRRSRNWRPRPWTWRA
jgi:hypothetical protein